MYQAISLEHEMFETMKLELSSAIAQAIASCQEGNLATVTLKIDIEEFDSNKDYKTLMPIDFNVKVTTKKDIVNEKMTIPSMRVSNRHGRMVGESADGQVTINDFMDKGKEDDN